MPVSTVDLHAVHAISSGTSETDLFDNNTGNFVVIQEITITNKSGGPQGCILKITDASNTELSRPLDDAITLLDGESYNMSRLPLANSEKLRFVAGAANITFTALAVEFEVS